MEEFQVPEDICDPSALQVESAGRFCASKDLPSLRDDSTESLNDRLDVLNSRLADDGGVNAHALSEQENFDDMFSLVRDFKYLRSEIKGRVLCILHEALKRIVSQMGGEGGGGSRSSSGGRRGSARRGRRGDGDGNGDGKEGGEGQQHQQRQGQASLSLRNALKMAVYLLFSAAFPAEECYSSAKQTEVLGKTTKGKGSRGGKKSSSSAKSSSSTAGGGGSAFKWEDAREAVLRSMRLALTVDPSRLWCQGVPDRCFMGIFLRLACKMLELPETIKNATQADLALELISEPFHLARSMETEFSAAVFLLLRENKHLADPLAKLCCHLVEKHGDARLGAELLREIGRMNMPDVNSKNTAAAAPVIHISEFLRGLVAVLPGTVHAHASVLLPHLSSRPYQIRQAVVYSLAEIVAAAHEDRKAVEDEAGAGGGEGRSGTAAIVEESKEGEGENQVKTDPRRVRMKDRNRNAILDQLVERALDTSPYVRLMVLRAWCVIVERGALPRKRFLVAARLGADRLRDQSSLVRKEAVKLLATLLEYNPYSVTLDLKVNEQSAKQAEAELRAMIPPTLAVPGGVEGVRSDMEAVDGKANDESDGGEDSDESESGESGREDNSNSNSNSSCDEEKEAGSGGGGGETQSDEGEEKEQEGAGGGEDDAAASAEENEEAMKRAAKAAQCDHLRAAVLFIKELELAGVRMSGMLGSTTAGDVVEALRFFVKACRFQLPNATKAIKKSLVLIWRAEGSIEAETKKAFVQVFVQPASKDSSGDEAPSPQEGLSAQVVARNLVNLVNESKAGELASLEEVISSLVKDNLDPDKDAPLDPEVFEQLWCTVSTKNQSPRRRAGALHAIAMGASANPSLVNGPQRLELVRETALGRATMEAKDWRTVRCACIALLRCDPEVVRNSREVDLILKRLCHFLQGKWCTPVSADAGDNDRAAAEAEMRDWFAAAEQAIAVLFHLDITPESLCASIVRRVATDSLLSPSSSSDDGCTSPLALARLCFVLGHFALKLLVYSEDLAGSLERARAKVKPPPKGSSGGGGACSGDDEDDDATAQELGLTAEASAEDERRLAELVEKEIVGRNLLGAFGPLLVRIVADESGSFGHPLVRQSSVLALSKFMCISEAFCDRNLSLLFTILERSKDTAVRSNVIVALGDLAFRFPNALEPWNQYIYERLRDYCPRVRANAIMVLTHLILNDMVKVKGQVSGLAVCMVDEEPRIRDAAKVFFHKYSERGTNPIYNVLPDIVGRLSEDENLAPADYREIIDFLMQYVKKDKLTELLATKLCDRLSNTKTLHQSRAVSYCLGQLKVTEKAVSRLAEKLPTYKDKLQDKEVYSNFTTVVSRAKKFATLEMTEAVTEWEAQLSKYHEGGAADEDAAKRASQAGRKRGGKRTTRSSTTSNSVGVGARRGGPGEKSKGEVDGERGGGDEPKRSSRGGSRKIKKRGVESDSDSDESEHNDSSEDEDAEGDDSSSSENELEADEHDEEDIFEDKKKAKGKSTAGGRPKKGLSTKVTVATARSTGSSGVEEEGPTEKPKGGKVGPAKAKKGAARVVLRGEEGKENRDDSKVTPTRRQGSGRSRSRRASPLSPTN